MAGYGLCKLRENIMKNFLLPIITVIFLIGCSEDDISNGSSQSEEQKKYEWRLVTSWPKNYPGLGMAPERIADLIEEMSNGQMKITVYGAGEQGPVEWRCRRDAPFGTRSLHARGGGAGGWSATSRTGWTCRLSDCLLSRGMRRLAGH